MCKYSNYFQRAQGYRSFYSFTEWPKMAQRSPPGNGWWALAPWVGTAERFLPTANENMDQCKKPVVKNVNKKACRKLAKKQEDRRFNRSKYAAVAPTKISITLSASDRDGYARRAFDAPEALYLR